MISTQIDRVVTWLKWPAAIFAFVSLPFWIVSFLMLAWEAIQSPLSILPFAIGMTAFFLLWKTWFNKRPLGNWAIQFEHEITHLLFAWLTLHRVVGFRASLAEGSQVQIRGHGNWLITSAPYFFPTLAVVLWIVSWFLPIPFLPWSSLVLGFAVGYHLISTWRETHRDQDDLKQLGWRFVWLFLPTANLVMLGCMLAYSFRGFDAVFTFLRRGLLGWWN